MVVMSLLLLLLPLPAGALDTGFGGQVRMSGSAGWYDSDHVTGLVTDDDALLDGSAGLRLKSYFGWGSGLTLDTHLEIRVAGGDTRQAASDLEQLTPAGATLTPGPPSDDSQLFSLTRILTDESGHIGVARVDRLVATYPGERVTLRLGRQALSWGNGMLFNPMDLFNPFSPADVVRDYKVGVDMVLVQTFVGIVSDLQVAYVPRRNPETGGVSFSESSLGFKMRSSLADIDWDLMAARHYADTVLGLGATRYVGGAAWRTDVTWTWLEDHNDPDGYLSAVTNLDYSWVWRDRNWYGLVELYFNGLGKNDATLAAMDTALIARLQRGEVFTTGRWYAAAQLLFEVHPLVNLTASGIVNLYDGSTLLQPYATWDAKQWLQVRAGLDIPLGSVGTEFGGDLDPFTLRTLGPPLRAYVQCTCYF
jgi:hypothetical protein